MTTNAFEFATIIHKGQSYGDKAYTYHLAQVVGIIIDNIGELGDKLHATDIQDVINAGWLHDSLEDTDTTLLELQEKFGSFCAHIVDNVTDEEGETREERKLKTWHKIRRHEFSIFVKLCDRLANVSNSGKLDMYRKEHPVFKAALYTPGKFEGLWAKIDEKLATKNPLEAGLNFS